MNTPNETEILVSFPRMTATVRKNEVQFYDWSVAYASSPDRVAEIGWSTTKRGAKISAINECRRKSGNYTKMKYKWINPK